MGDSEDVSTVIVSWAHSICSLETRELWETYLEHNRKKSFLVVDYSSKGKFQPLLVTVTYLEHNRKFSFLVVDYNSKGKLQPFIVTVKDKVEILLFLITEYKEEIWPFTPIPPESLHKKYRLLIMKICRRQFTRGTSEFSTSIYFTYNGSLLGIQTNVGNIC